MGHAWNQVYINGSWYNIDLTWFTNDRNIRNLLQDDENFKIHFPDDSSVKEQCLAVYPRERLNYFLEIVKNYPNFFIEYEKEKGNKIA